MTSNRSRKYRIEISFQYESVEIVREKTRRLPVQCRFLLAMGRISHGQSFVASFGLHRGHVENKIGSIYTGACLASFGYTAIMPCCVTRSTNLIIASRSFFTFNCMMYIGRIREYIERNESERAIE